MCWVAFIVDEIVEKRRIIIIVCMCVCVCICDIRSLADRGDPDRITDITMYNHESLGTDPVIL